MLKQGLYEQLINQELKEEIRSAEAAERQRVETGAVDAAESARVLAEYVAKLLEKRLTAVAEESGMEEAEEEQVRLINQMLSTLGSESGKDLLPLTEERRVGSALVGREYEEFGVCVPGAWEFPASGHVFGAEFALYGFRS